MRFFTLLELISAIAVYAAFGAFSGVIYLSIDLLHAGVKLILFLPIDIWKKERKRIINEDISRQSGKINAISANVYDFLYTLIFGIFYIAVTYLFFDGIFRIYFAVLFFLCFLLSKKTFGRFLGKILIFLMGIVYNLLYFALYPLSIPVRISVRLGTVFLRPIKRLVSNTYFRVRAQWIKKRKLHRAEAFLESAILK